MNRKKSNTLLYTKKQNPSSFSSARKTREEIVLRREVKAKGIRDEKASAYIENALAEEECLKNLGNTVTVTPRSRSRSNHSQTRMKGQSNSSFQGSFKNYQIATNIGFQYELSRPAYRINSPLKRRNQNMEGLPKKQRTIKSSQITIGLNTKRSGNTIRLRTEERSRERSCIRQREEFR